MPNLIYTRDIPDGPHNPSNDQGPMKVNTNSTDTLIAVDHYSFNDNNGGWHKQCTFPIESAPTTVASQLAIYSKTGSLGTELFMIRDGVGGTETNLTSSKIAAPTVSANGITFLPGGLLIQWGFNAAAASGVSINFPTPFPNNGFSISVTVANNNTVHRTYVSTNGLSKTAFTPILLSTNGNPESDDIFWMAIGN